MWSSDILQYLLTNISVWKVFFVLLSIKCIQILWSRRHYYLLSWKIDGPISLPFLGNMLQMWARREDMVGLMFEYAEQYTTPLSFWLGPILMVAVADPRDVQLIASHPNSMQKPSVYQFPKLWLGNGLFTAPYRIWIKERKMVESTFNVPVLDSYVNIFNRESQILINELKQHANTNKAFEIWDFTCRCTLDIVGKTMLGVKFDCQKFNKETNSYGNDYQRATGKAFALLIDRIMRPWLMPEYFWEKSKIYRELKKEAQVLLDVTDEVIASRYDRESLLKKHELVGQRIMIDELFRDNTATGLPDEQLRAHMNTMVATGADATGNVLAYVFLLLAMHPEVQEQLYQEIMDETGDTDPKDLFVTRFTFQNMTVLDCVIKETLRLFPISPFIARYTTGDVQLKSRDITIKKNTVVLIVISLLHRDKSIWGEDANLYKPSRFQMPHDRHPSAYVPFSSGQRNCVGYKYAMWSMKVIVMHVLRSYKILTDEKYCDIKCYSNVLLKKTGGWPIRIEAR